MSARGEGELCKCGHPATHHASVSRYCLWLGCDCKGVEPTPTGAGEGEPELERPADTIARLLRDLTTAREEAGRLGRERDDLVGKNAQLGATVTLLYQTIRQHERGEYSRANSLDVQQLDARCANLILDRVKLERTLAAQDAELAGVREDAKRLDWLEAQVSQRCVSLEGAPPRGLVKRNQWFVHRNGIGYAGTAPTAREAIDAARSGGAGKEG